MEEISSVEFEPVFAFFFSKPNLVGLRQHYNNSHR